MLVAEKDVLLGKSFKVAVKRSRLGRRFRVDLRLSRGRIEQNS
jgi:hypothetical protein